jgi:hypothetical protein
MTGPFGVGKSTVSRLTAATIGEESMYVPIDDFTRFVVNGWVEPWLPESAHQNEVLGGAVVAAAMQFADGGYTVVVDARRGSGGRACSLPFQEGSPRLRTRLAVAADHP